MPTNLAIDDALLEEARKVSGIKTKRETVNQALAEFIQRRRAEELIKAFGSVEYDPAWDYKQGRSR
jgi:Arc/MetJ family transcription regulator